MMDKYRELSEAAIEMGLKQHSPSKDLVLRSVLTTDAEWDDIMEYALLLREHKNADNIACIFFKLGRSKKVLAQCEALEALMVKFGLWEADDE